MEEPNVYGAVVGSGLSKVRSSPGKQFLKKSAMSTLDLDQSSQSCIIRHLPSGRTDNVEASTATTELVPCKEASSCLGDTKPNRHNPRGTAYAMNLKRRTYNGIRVPNFYRTTIP